MRVIAAEIAITPRGMSEIEVGMFPMQLDVPAPARTLPYLQQLEVRLTLHTSRGDQTIRGQIQLRPEWDDQRSLSEASVYSEIVASAEGRRQARQD